MRQALLEAQKGVGHVEPNPPVGCVILDKNHRFLSSGHHKQYGGPHAEIHALNQVRDKTRLKGAFVFVTLEPCHHTGKTPSCAGELAKYPLHSVIYGATDPFTKGRGLKFLREKGIQTRHLTAGLREELNDLIQAFVFSFLKKRAFVSLKLATTLNGMISMPHRRWITGSEARRHGHFLRASHQGVVVGVQTLLQDNPRLNVRLKGFSNRKNKVIILDPQGKSLPFLPTSRLLSVRPPGQVMVCLSKKHLAGAKKTLPRLFKKPFPQSKNPPPLGGESGAGLPGLAAVPTHPEGYFDLSHLLDICYREWDVSSVLVEGGGVSVSHFIRQLQAQRFYLYVSPLVSAGKGLEWSQSLKGFKNPASFQLKRCRWDKVGRDFLMTGHF